MYPKIVKKGLHSFKISGHLGTFFVIGTVKSKLFFQNLHSYSYKLIQFLHSQTFSNK